MLTQEDIKIIKDLLQSQGAETDRKIEIAITNLERSLKMNSTVTAAKTEAALKREIIATEANIKKEMNERFNNVDEQFLNLIGEITRDIMPLYATNEELEKVKKHLDNHINNHKFG